VFFIIALSTRFVTASFSALFYTSIENHVLVKLLVTDELARWQRTSNTSPSSTGTQGLLHCTVPSVADPEDKRVIGDPAKSPPFFLIHMNAG